MEDEDNDDMPNTGNFFKDFIVGAFSAAASKTVVGPIERVMHLHQLHKANQNIPQ